MNSTSKVIWHSSETMPEVKSGSVKLFIAASVHLGTDIEWPEYERLFGAVYVREGLRVLRENGFLVSIQTDPRRGGGLFCKNHNTQSLLQDNGFRLLDMKVWKRCESNMFQLPFSQVMIFAKLGGNAHRKSIKTTKEFERGVWEFTTQSNSKNFFPAGLCRILVENLTLPGDLILDPFAGSGKILGVARSMGRNAIGYEIDQTMKPYIDENLAPTLL